MNDLKQQCILVAQKMVDSGLVIGDVSVEDAADILYKLELEKLEKNSISDSNIDYNDEIVDIQFMGEMETVDISVSGDNLFFCNGILTKNSFGLPATADFMFALVATEELHQMNQIMVKQLKNRYSDPNNNKRFVIGVDRPKMKLYDVEESAQKDIVDSGQDDDKPINTFGNRDRKFNKKFEVIV